MIARASVTQFWFVLLGLANYFTDTNFVCIWVRNVTTLMPDEIFKTIWRNHFTWNVFKISRAESLKFKRETRVLGKPMSCIWRSSGVSDPRFHLGLNSTEFSWTERWIWTTTEAGLNCRWTLERSVIHCAQQVWSDVLCIQIAYTMHTDDIYNTYIYIVLYGIYPRCTEGGRVSWGG